MAAYVAKGILKTSIWVRALDGSASRMIEATGGADYPFWSPDSRSIAFFAGGKLMRVKMAGGTPRAICDLPLGIERQRSDCVRGLGLQGRSELLPE